MLRRLRSAAGRFVRRAHQTAIGTGESEVGPELGWDAWVLGHAEGAAGAATGWLLKRRRQRRDGPSQQ